MATTSSNTILNSTLSEETWVLLTRKNLENESLLNQNIPISVCQVPNSISAVNPQAYAPQVISLGPYHYLRPELYQMERIKIDVVKSYWNYDQIELVVKKLKEIGPKIRACYHKYLDLNDDTLALMLAVDGLFLIYLLSKDLNGFTYDATVFSDVMMLENQIPMILLKEIVNTISLSKDDDAKLFSMMWVFCESQSPFDIQLKEQDFQETKVLHLLDLLHKMITFPQSIAGESNKQHVLDPQEVELSRQPSLTIKIDPANDQAIQNLEGILTSDLVSSIKPIKFITSLPWGMISNLLAQSFGLQEVSTDNPLVEEIDIPSVSQLSKMAGITFKRQNSGTLEASFNDLTVTLYLPGITLNGNSEVIFRNLEAYEMASSSSTSGYKDYVLTQYLDFMCGIIDRKEDVSLLRRAGIVKGSLTDLQVADLFNGMNKSSQKVYKDSTAAIINKYYQQKLKVKAYSFVMKYVYNSWKLLTVVSTILLLLLLIFESFCDVYDCRRVTR